APHRFRGSVFCLPCSPPYQALEGGIVRATPRLRNSVPDRAPEAKEVRLARRGPPLLRKSPAARAVTRPPGQPQPKEKNSAPRGSTRGFTCESRQEGSKRVRRTKCS